MHSYIYQHAVISEAVIPINEDLDQDGNGRGDWKGSKEGRLPSSEADKNDTLKQKVKIDKWIKKIDRWKKC